MTSLVFRHVAIVVFGLGLVTAPAVASPAWKGAGPDARAESGQLLNASIEDLADLLSLTSEQVAAIERVRARYATASAETRAEIARLQVEMKDLYTSGSSPSDDAIEHLQQRMLSAQNRLARTARKAHRRARRVLQRGQIGVAHRVLGDRDHDSDNDGDGDSDSD